MRALAQSMARELGPQNIHVAHIIIDGAIDTEWIKANFPDRYNAGPDAILNPDDIAEAYWQLHRQKRSAWTFEMDLRPWKETWYAGARTQGASEAPDSASVARSFKNASIMSMVGVAMLASSLRSAIKSASASISSGLPA